MRGTASQFWEDAALGYFEGMTSEYQPGEKADRPEVGAIRRVLPSLTASQGIIAAIAGCTPQRGKSELVPVSVHQASLAEVD